MKYEHNIKKVLKELQIYSIKLHDVKKFMLGGSEDSFCLLSVTNKQLNNDTRYSEKVYYGWTPSKNIHFINDKEIINRKLLDKYINDYVNDNFKPMILN